MVHFPSVDKVSAFAFLYFERVRNYSDNHKPSHFGNGTPNSILPICHATHQNGAEQLLLSHLRKLFFFASTHLALANAPSSRTTLSGASSRTTLSVASSPTTLSVAYSRTKLSVAYTQLVNRNLTGRLLLLRVSTCLAFVDTSSPRTILPVAHTQLAIA